MSKSVNFSTDNLPKQWQYVKRNLREMGIVSQAGIEDIEVRARLVVEAFFQRGVFAEFRQQLKADVYERADEREDIRSGTYARYFTTTFGRARLLIPKVRKKSKEYFYNLFAKYQRRQEKFDDMVVLSMLLGFSTRKQQKFFRAFIGDSVSHQTASRLLHGLADDLRVYQTKPIEDRYRFLLLDGLWVHIKEIDIKKRPILFALGITKDGKQEIIAFKLAKGETEEEYTAFLNDLYRRGLLGKSLELIIQDGSEAITAAVNTVYPYTPRQRCYTHKLRNLLQNIRHKIKHRPKMARQASNIYKASSRQEAIRRFRIFVNRWRHIEPRATKCFQDEFYHTLNFYDFPKAVRSAISTTNHLERFLEEIRRRIKIQGYFKNERSLNLWMFGLIKHINLNPIQQPKGYASKQKCEIILA
ncbi:MAG: IS256 family transposase [Candidatus Omnitrophota bacterium]